jgi:type III secretory pathway component EscR
MPPPIFLRTGVSKSVTAASQQDLRVASQARHHTDRNASAAPRSAFCRRLAEKTLSDASLKLDEPSLTTLVPDFEMGQLEDIVREGGT